MVALFTTRVTVEFNGSAVCAFVVADAEIMKSKEIMAT
jgi:hypothetical protein